MKLQLPTGNTLVVSTFEYLFILKEEDVDEFYQNCIADDLGVYMDNPFSDRGLTNSIEIEEINPDSTEDIE